MDVACRFRRESDGKLDPMVAVFFAGYDFIIGLVLINIVVAVLLDDVAREGTGGRRARNPPADVKILRGVR